MARTPPLRLLPPPPLPPPPQAAAVKPQPPAPPRFSNKEFLPRPRRTNPFVWFAAVLCFVFSLILIVAGICTLIVFLAIKPRLPTFAATAASLRNAYLDTPEFFNGDLIFSANFSNPNRKMDVRFEYLTLDLLFFDTLIGTQWIDPFALRRGEAREVAVHMISSEVYLPPKLSAALQKQLQSNRVQYTVRGTFRVRVSFGFNHFAYWLHGRCRIELTGPPAGILVARSCKTKR